MEYLNEVQDKKRKAAAAARREQEALKQAQIAKESAGEITATIAQQSAKTRLEQEKLAKTDDIQGVVDSINKLNVTTFLASKDNWSQIANDIAAAADRIQTVISNLDGGASKIDESLTKAVETLGQAIRQMQSVKIESDREVLEEIKKQNKLLSKLKLDPKINVKAPQVSVAAPDIDLSGISEAIETLRTEPEEEKIKFKDFIGQDIDNENPGFQYIGMVNGCDPEIWCIVEIDLESDSMRFALGRGDYKTAFRNHMAIKYSYWDEALDAVQA